MQYRLWMTTMLLVAVIGTPEVSQAAAEDDDTVVISEKSLEAEISLGADQKGMRDGWHLEYGGYRNTPILLDPRENPEDSGSARQRVYPPLHAEGMGKLKEQNNLSVDDEVDKTKLISFQQIHSATDDQKTMQNSFSENTRFRDNHINLFKTVRGVAVLTLSYLDKTVAAGLATVQQQVDQDTTHQLLKQINLNTAKLANPERERLYSDVEEKFEACMASNGGSSPPEYLSHVSIECSSCDELKSSGGTGGYYHYCVCCAETSTSVNKSIRDQTGEPYWSLVERVMYGLKKPSGGVVGAGHNPQAIVDVADYFRELYGDIKFTSGSGSGGGETFKFEYVVPAYSVPTIIQTFRDGPENEDGTCPDTAGPMSCPLTGQYIKHGICPAFRQLVNWENKGDLEQMRINKDQQLVEHWLEASLGIPLDAQALQAVLHSLSENPDPNQDVYGTNGDGKPLYPRIVKFTETFCDASAISAVKKMHLRMISIIEDHLALNQKATEREKALIRLLINRYTSYFALGNADAQAAELEVLLNAVKIDSDRKSMAATASFNAAMASSQDMNAQIGEILSIWGGTVNLNPPAGPPPPGP